MFLQFILRKIRFISHYSQSRAQTGGGPQTDGGPQTGGGQRANNGPRTDGDPPAEDRHAIELGPDLDDNAHNLRSALGGGDDVNLHRLRCGPDNAIAGVLVYLSTLVDHNTMTEAILRPLTGWRCPGRRPPRGRELLDTLAQEVLCAGDIQTVAALTELSYACLSGDTVLLLDGCQAGLVIHTRGWKSRGITEPQSETVVRGPREGFTEDLRTNVSMMRRKIRSGRLQFDHMVVGRKTKTNLCVMYLDGVADPKVVKEVKSRLDSLEVDSILESGCLEEYIEDAPFSIFATTGYSEKPDVTAARVLEGRVAILIDGTPFSLTAPMLFIESFQTAEDYYARPIYASIIRLLRFVAFFITVFAPAVYIALTTFHHELIPTTLLFTIANAREGTPFPVFVEALIMVFAFEILREAGIRLPRPVGQAISIVGALIMGDAAVSAGVVGAPMVITIALTAVAGFIVPSQNEAGSILRIIMMVLGAFMGFYGVSLGFLAMLVYLATLYSFGVPYFDGLAWSQNQQDTLIRMPLWFMIHRPQDIARGDITRRRFFIPPPRPFETKKEDAPQNGGEEK